MTQDASDYPFFPRALRELGHYRPTLMRSGVLRAGSVVLHVWLLRLGLYYVRAVRPPV